MAAFGIDGLVSGLDTTGLITKLMQIESAPQSLLKTKQGETSALVTALQNLNVKVASLAASATKAAAPASWTAWRAASSAEGVTASITDAARAQATAVTFTVDAAATSQLSVSAVQPLGAAVVAGGGPVSVAVTSGGTTVTVAAGSGTLDEVARAVNGAKAGVTATVVRGGTAADGTAEYRLQLTGTATGEAATFDVTATSADGTTVTLDATEVRPPRDAQITIFGRSVTSPANRFEDLVAGVDVTVSAQALGKEVTVTTQRDDDAVRSLASGLVDNLGLVLSEITSRTTSTSATDSDGRTVVTGGVLSGDPAVRDLQQSLLQAASYPVDGVSPSSVGIALGKDGTFTFDQKAFDAALASDPAKVVSVVSTLARRVADVAEASSDTRTGTLTLKVQSQQDVVKDLGAQIESWDVRLALRREGLQTQYSQLEVTLSHLQSQSSWLSGQLAALTNQSGS